MEMDTDIVSIAEDEVGLEARLVADKPYILSTMLHRTEKLIRAVLPRNQL